MAKGNGKAKTAKSNGRAKSKKDTAKPKPTAEQLSDQQRQTLLFNHKRKLKPLLVAEKFAKAAVSKQYELAKKEGVTKKELAIALLLETEEGHEKVKAQMQQILDVDRWMGKELGNQLELFAKDSVAERDFEAGRRAALDDQPRKPPDHLSNAGCQRWMEGWTAGNRQVVDQRAEGFKPLGGEAVSLGEATAGVVAGLGTEEATHREAA